MTVEIKRVGAGDTSWFERIAPDVFDEPIHSERLAAHLADPSHLLIVAIDDGQIVGQTAAVLHRHPDKATELYIDDVGVTPSRQRQGIARQMLGAMLAWGCELDCEEAWLGTETDNTAANALYARYTEPETFLLYLWDLVSE